jgi:hypothetical protein
VHTGIILFYSRRVQNINGLFLQDTVGKVLQHAQAVLTFGRHLSIQSFSAAVELAQKVWKQSLESDDYTFSLFDVVNQDVCSPSLLYNTPMNSESNLGFT